MAPEDPRFAKTVFVVEADRFAQHELWVKYSRESREAGFGPAKPSGRSLDWKQESRGFVAQVGDFGGMPVNVACSWAIIDEQRVLFYYACSMVTHSDMVDEWLKSKCNPTWDNGHRRARCDAMNFHHCIDAIDERNASAVRFAEMAD